MRLITTKGKQPFQSKLLRLFRAVHERIMSRHPSGTGDGTLGEVSFERIDVYYSRFDLTEIREVICRDMQRVAVELAIRVNKRSLTILNMNPSREFVFATRHLKLFCPRLVGTRFGTDGYGSPPASEGRSSPGFLIA